nr:hypothetical transcript [Hymenolepis microstoma]
MMGSVWQTEGIELSSVYRNRARKELNEDPKQVQAHLESFRRWIKSMPHLNCPTDDKFLLAFLRHAKYNHSKAQVRLDNYCTFRTSPTEGCPEWFVTEKHEAQLVRKLLDQKVSGPLGFLDNGAVVFLVRFSKVDESELSYESMRRLDKVFDEICILDERKQIGGYVLIFDFTGVSMRQAKLSFGPKNSKLEGQYYQECMPMRVGKLIFYNMPSFFEGLYKVAYHYLKEKIKSKVLVLSGSLKPAFDEIPGLEKVCPQEYGGQAPPFDELCDMMNKEAEVALNNRRQIIISVDEISFSIEDLQQENYALKLRAHNLETMEREYQEEIEELRKEESAMNITQDPNLSTTDIVQQIGQLQQQLEQCQRDLEVSEKKVSELKSENSQLRERIDILEISKDNMAMNNTADNTIDELMSKMENLTLQLLSEQSEIKRLHILNSEKDEDLNSARMNNRELEITIKNLREEIVELSMEREALKMQIGSVGNTRGNSLFSEVEDRRRRAELLVKKQQEKIVELENNLANIQSESQKKLLQLQRELDSNVTKIYKDYIDKLYTENDRLTREVARLESVENWLRDEHLGKNKEKVRMSAAFGRDTFNQESLVKALEERIVAYKCATDKAKCESMAIRERLMSEYRAHYDLNLELAHQRSLVKSLSQELQMIKLATSNNKENLEEIKPSCEESIYSPPTKGEVIKENIYAEEHQEKLKEDKVECNQS